MKHVPGDDGEPKKSWPEKIKEFGAVLVAGCAILAFLGLVAYLFTRTSASTTENEWNRAIYLFAAVEALAFAGAGYLWGREVHRERAEQAEEEVKTLTEISRDKDARNQLLAERTHSAEARFLALSSSIKAKDTKVRDLAAAAPGAVSEALASQIGELATLANELGGPAPS